MLQRENGTQIFMIVRIGHDDETIWRAVGTAGQTANTYRGMNTKREYVVGDNTHNGAD